MTWLADVIELRPSKPMSWTARGAKCQHVIAMQPFKSAPGGGNHFELRLPLPLDLVLFSLEETSVAEAARGQCSYCTPPEQSEMGL